MEKLKYDLEKLNALNHNTLMEKLGIEYTEVREGFIAAIMPVDERTLQPMGILHGGASLALAETLGSLGSALMVDLDHYDVRGSSLNANHTGSVSGGFVTGIAQIIHKGRFTHIWDIKIFAPGEKVISIARLTTMIIEKKT